MEQWAEDESLQLLLNDLATSELIRQQLAVEKDALKARLAKQSKAG